MPRNRMNTQPNGSHANDVQPLYVTLILDESGSMEECKGAAIAGFNQYVATLRQEPAETRFTLTLFNASKTEVRYRNVRVSAVQDLDVKTYRPDESTPLYDAIGRTLNAARQESPLEAKTLCVILTDGMENASEEYSRKQIYSLIKTCEQQGWAFLYPIPYSSGKRFDRRTIVFMGSKSAPLGKSPRDTSIGQPGFIG